MHMLLWSSAMLHSDILLESGKVARYFKLHFSRIKRCVFLVIDATDSINDAKANAKEFIAQVVNAMSDGDLLVLIQPGPDSKPKYDEYEINHDRMNTINECINLITDENRGTWFESSLAFIEDKIREFDELFVCFAIFLTDCEVFDANEISWNVDKYIPSERVAVATNSNISTMLKCWQNMPKSIIQDISQFNPENFFKYNLILNLDTQCTIQQYLDNEKVAECGQSSNCKEYGNTFLIWNNELKNITFPLSINLPQTVELIQITNATSYLCNLLVLLCSINMGSTRYFLAETENDNNFSIPEELLTQLYSWDQLN